MTAYYNEIDPYAAQWLRNLIDAGHIAPGVVDERSIHDVKPAELKGYTQCHFFAGLGGWSYALRRAGWADDRPVWTGSCPCQPFSSAGLAGGFTDERHLWPFFHFLIEECGPGVVFGEQVASKDGLAWLDLVQTDLEGAGYAFGAVDLCAAGVGAPHIRQRSWFVAERLEHPKSDGWDERRAEPDGRSTAAGCGSCGLADTELPERREGDLRRATVYGEESERNESTDCPGQLRETCGLADTTRQQHDRTGDRGETGRAEHTDGGDACGLADTKHQIPSRGRTEQLDKENGERETVGSNTCSEDVARPTASRPTDHLWRAADWLFCRDGKWRPVEPGTSPLAHGAPARVGRLRAYGNAINVEAAKVFIESYMETRPK